jgi:4-oxalocrotonate tautomerase
MPHVIVKLWPGRSEAQKQSLTEAITQDVIKHLGSSDESISVAFEEVPSEQWGEKVYKPEITGGAARLYKKPGYSM